MEHSSWLTGSLIYLGAAVLGECAAGERGPSRPVGWTGEHRDGRRRAAS